MLKRGFEYPVSLQNVCLATQDLHFYGAVGYWHGLDRHTSLSHSFMLLLGIGWGMTLGALQNQKQRKYRHTVWPKGKTDFSWTLAACGHPYCLQVVFSLEPAFIFFLFRGLLLSVATSELIPCACKKYRARMLMEAQVLRWQDLVLKDNYTFYGVQAPYPWSEGSNMLYRLLWVFNQMLNIKHQTQGRYPMKVPLSLLSRLDSCFSSQSERIKSSWTCAAFLSLIPLYSHIEDFFSHSFLSVFPICTFHMFPLISVARTVFSQRLPYEIWQMAYLLFCFQKF